MEIKQCTACGQQFQPRPQVPGQSYCSTPDCQRERRRRWQGLKLQTDPDYRENQARSQQAWSQRHLDYWRGYRQTHPEYVERNRGLQQARNAKRRAGTFAKMDVPSPAIPLPSGVYLLSPVTDDEIAKMDVWVVKITVHACHCVPDGSIAKR